jgi:hypothetical protein
MRALPHLLPHRQRVFLGHTGGECPRTSFALLCSCEKFVRTIRSLDAVHNLYDQLKVNLSYSDETVDEFKRLRSWRMQMTGSAMMVVESKGIEEGRTRVRPRLAQHLNVWFRPSAVRSVLMRA